MQTPGLNNPLALRMIQRLVCGRLRRCVFGRTIRSVRSLDRIFQYAPESFNAVLPSDLLPFFVGAPVIRDADFINAQFHPRYLHSHFRLEAETVLLKLDRLNDLAPETL